MGDKYKLLFDPNPTRLADRINDLAVQGYTVAAFYSTQGLGVQMPPPPDAERRHKYRAPEIHDTHFAWMVKASERDARWDMADDPMLRAHADLVDA